MSRRRLTPEERALWSKVTAQAERLERRVPEQQAPRPKPKPQTKPQVTAPHRSPVRKPPASAAQHVTMDQKAFLRLGRGKLKPEARIDLHGMTLDLAHSALTRFILTAQASGKRLVLVITGKGREGDAYDPTRAPRGVL